MGTYMSAFIEVDHSGGSPSFTDPVQIYSLTEGSFSFDKDYAVFDALAGGRDSAMPPEDRDPRRAPLFAPRGIPSPCSLTVAWEYFYLIADASGPPDPHFWPEHRCVSTEVAERWRQEHGCHESRILQWFNCGPIERMWRVVSEPKLYNASGLRLDEFDAALAHHRLNLAALPVEYQIVRSAMSLLVQKHGPQRVRLVVWFS